MNPDPEGEDARLDRLAAVLAAPTPRVLPPDLVRRVKNDAGAFVSVVFGAFFAGFGLLFVWLFFPWQLPSELALALPDTRATEGRIVRVERTNFSVNDETVQAYDFAFVASDGTAGAGRCYTTGPRWQAGDLVAVRYRLGSAAAACPEGARLSKGGMLGLLVLIFPSLGLGVAGYTLVARRRAERILRQGMVAEVRVRAVEATNVRVNQRTVYRLTLERCDAVGAEPLIERRSDPVYVRLAGERLASGQPMFVLVDPQKPTRTLWIELF